MSNNNFLEDIKQQINSSINVKQSILADESLLLLIYNIAKVMIEAVNRDNKIIFFGNGGSAADAIHVTAELVGGMSKKNAKALPAISLCENLSSITAISNDYSYEDVFKRQMEAIGRKDDVAIGISTSGNSKNVIEALKTSKNIGLTTIGFTGMNKGEMLNICDYLLQVPSNNTQKIQEAHIMIWHIIVEIVEKNF